ncbi:MAG TPA: SRPBCC domain-containing protein [Xanthobacteraceae bacterium]|jgi:uncharacterized protein YndB with AHSA1/START domain
MSTAKAGDTIVQEITIKAPAERVFAALAEPDQRVKWWAGGGRFKATHMESDLRKGGHWMMAGSGMGGKPFTLRGVYRQVERPRVLEFTWLPSWQQEPLETVVRFELRDSDGVTTVRVIHSGLITESSRSQNRGWPDILAGLRAFIEN